MCMAGGGGRAGEGQIWPNLALLSLTPFKDALREKKQLTQVAPNEKKNLLNFIFSLPPPKIDPRI